MSTIKPSSHGIVVENKDNGMHYAISDVNYNSETHRKVRDLKPGETVRNYRPRRVEPLSEIADTTEGADSGTQEKEGK